MTRKVLGQDFFNRPTEDVAKELLGKFLVRKLPSGAQMEDMITEVEVYDGFRDKASHASRGKTERNTPMFKSAGRWYVYFTYGMHWMLNIVTREKDYPAAILIRGLEHVSGPGRLTKKMMIDKSLNDQTAQRRSGLWIEDRGVKIPANKIKKTPRIGVSYAGPRWASRRWRFFVKIN